MIRLFVALALPERLRPWVQGLQSGIPGARWAVPENLHLTLRFIGNVDGRLFADIMDVLAAIRAPAFDLQLAGLGQFGERGRVDSLWVGAGRNQPLDRLQGKVETALQRLGLEPEHRKFLPHLTVGRLKSAPAGRVAEWLAAHAGFALPPFRIDRFTLFSSYLAREGAIYRAEAEYPLTEAA
ncbi:RNA 2',3'-cyclic phosphodiesterase [Desertibaculum subflavum]|uniref:RNA 2',3'-cyclic phosphodiesterase n=1 Tax=Desertibaculum subflavum TaxID=2268458 RepID=UPI000E674A80